MQTKNFTNPCSTHALEKGQEKRWKLAWVEQGDKHEAVVPLPFNLPAKYVINEGKDVTLYLALGEYPRIGALHIGYFFASVEEAKEAAERHLAEELKKNKLQMIL